MSKLNELLQEFCPDGVKYYELSNVCDFIKGKGLCKSDIGTGNTPVILYGELYTTYTGYIKKVVSLSATDKVCSKAKIHTTDILIPISSTTKEAKIGRAAVYSLDSDAYLGSDAAILRHTENSGYLMYVINSDWFEKEKMKCVSGTTIQHLSLEKLAKIRIPLPPLPVQQEIVRILDSFTELTAELTAELAARRKQYEHYRDELLTFGDDVPILTTSQLKKTSFWLMPATPNYTEKGVPYITSKNIKNGKILFRDVKFISPEDYSVISANRKIEKSDLLITMIGTIGEAAFVGENTAFYGQNLYLIRLDDEKINKEFFYYWLTSPRIKSSLVSKKNASSQGYIKSGAIENLKVPCPKLCVQNDIVATLSKFDALCNDLTSGLPAEIATRQKQYEYYRDKLLTFKEA